MYKRQELQRAAEHFRRVGTGKALVQGQRAVGIGAEHAHRLQIDRRLDRPGTVSYTHLDVYKRQAQKETAAAAAATRKYRELEKQFEQARVEDVYKRQLRGCCGSLPT